MTILTPPDPHRVEDVTAPDGAIIRVRQHGNLDGPRLMMSHGNGLAIDGYYPFWRLFLDRFEVVLHDLRNHGQNPFCGGERHNYDGFVDDYEALAAGGSSAIRRETDGGAISFGIGSRGTASHPCPWLALGRAGAF